MLGMMAFVNLLWLAMTSVSSAGLFQKDETVGDQFRKVMKKKAEYCATHKIGPANRRCDIVKLKPADPLTTEEGRFAYSIRIPNPVPEDSGYKPGMTSQEYFEHLCKAEAGEFIYKTVENVEGLYMMRPRRVATDDELSHLDALEDPYGHENSEAKEAEFQYVSPNRYSFVEASLSDQRELAWKKQYRHESYFKGPADSAKHVTYSGFNAKTMKAMVKQFTANRKSRYGFTWRGVTRPHDRDLGIAGGELIVLDLETREVLAVRRGYIRTGGVRDSSSGIWWPTGQACPAYGYRNGLNKDFDFSYWFIGKVLKPKNYMQSFKELVDGK